MVVGNCVLLLEGRGGGRVVSQMLVKKVFVGPCSHRDMDYCIGSNFWKSYLIKTGFTLGEPVSLVKKVFRLFKLEQMFLVLRESVDTVGVDV
jgi:hypothetical protein